MESNVTKNVTQAGANKMLGQQLYQSARAAREQADKTQVERRLLQMSVPAARAQMELDKTEFGEQLRKWNRLMRSIQGADSTR